MSLGDYDKKALELVSRYRLTRIIFLSLALIGLVSEAGKTIAPIATALKEKIAFVAGIKPTADQIRNERYVYLSGFYLRFVQEYISFATQNPCPSPLLSSAEERLASTFEGTSFKYSSAEFLASDLTLEQRLNALQALRARMEVNADRLGARYRAMFDSGYYLAGLLQRTAEVELRNLSAAEQLNFTLSSYKRAQDDSPFKFPDLPIESNSCKGSKMTNQCVIDVIESVKVIKDFLRIHV